jgi:2'-5' RNA ligase
MRYAIELMLDDPPTRVLRSVKRRLAATLDVPAPPVSADPHVTLGVCDTLDVERCQAVLADLALEPPLPCRFDSLGIFAANPTVLFAAPVVTAELLALHATFHERFRPIATGQSAFYLPGRWVPHCTLAERVPPDLIADAVAIARTLPLPITGHVAGLRIVDIPAARIIDEIAYPSAR